nr:DNA polymerase III subunit delta' [Mesocricetibacter intestinalis]
MLNLYPWLLPDYEKIRQTFLNGRGHHALLLRSESGIGTEQLAKATANLLLCQHINAAQKACGQCHSCQLFRAGSHPDFYLLAPIENKDIGVDQVREISEKVSQHAQQGGNKVVYLQGAERLTENAANALLKTLEEPRPQTYFLLQSDISAALPATIYSRCQPWVIHCPSTQKAAQWLMEECTASAQDIAIALRINYGRVLSARDCLQGEMLQKRLILFTQFWRFYQRKDPLELLPHFDKEIIFQQLDWLISFLSDALKARLNISQHWLNTDFSKAVNQFAERQSAASLLRAYRIMQNIRSDLATINGVNQELILLDGLSKLLINKETA